MESTRWSKVRKERRKERSQAHVSWKWHQHTDVTSSRDKNTCAPHMNTHTHKGGENLPTEGESSQTRPSGDRRKREKADVSEMKEKWMMGGFHGTDPGLYGCSEVEESLIRTEKKKKQVRRKRSDCSPRSGEARGDYGWKEQEVMQVKKVDESVGQVSRGRERTPGVEWGWRWCLDSSFLHDQRAREGFFFFFF